MTEGGAPLDVVALAILGLWGVMLCFVLYSIASSKYSALALFTVPVGLLSLVVVAIVSSEVAAYTPFGLLDEFAQAFIPAKLKAVDVILSGLLVMVAFGFSSVTGEIDKLTRELLKTTPK
eukprot:TRINITY_DN8004_c1_g2_i1.p2 TRINITY_DN8004_c1_g2~~TRINITY_DN8004_c1_g2_i1.p2  ORF type:complete len:136 (+),score=31.42 TRINITY_DN8004_c1_g2_i1:49-408(+)